MRSIKCDFVVTMKVMFIVIKPILVLLRIQEVQ
jgi:hypothetical protein